MTIRMEITSIKTKKVFDISELCSVITLTTSLLSQPGKLEFDMLDNKDVYVQNGDIILLNVEGKDIFKGKVFTRKRSELHSWSIMAYDNLRYFSSEDTLLFDASTLTSRFERICRTLNMDFKVLDRSNYNCAAVVENYHTYYEMVENAIEETRKANGQRFGFWDNNGTIELFNLNRQITNLVIGDGSLMTKYNFEASIDRAANYVKVVREDQETGKREIHVAQDSSSVGKWGQLQRVELVTDADLNASMLKERARELLKDLNKETVITTLTAIGDLSIRAGKSFTWRVSDLERENGERDRLCLVTQCTQVIGAHPEMMLEVEVI